MQFDLPYLVQDVDRHGNVRLYARKKVTGRLRRERIRAQPGSPTFLDEYKAALDRLTAGRKEAESLTIKIGTLGWLVAEYEQSFAFKKLAPREQRVRHLILESCLNEETKAGSGYRFRDCPLAEFTSEHVRLMRDRKKGRPGAANNRVKWLSAMFSWGCEEKSGWFKANPAKVKKAPYNKTTFHTWTREEFLQFEARHPLGSKARLALAILAYTGMRRSDAVQLGPKHVKGDKITFTPQKTSTTTGKTLKLPLLDVLKKVLDSSPLGTAAFLETDEARSKPFTSNGFGNWFRRRCNEAGLPHCTAHGIRRAAATFAAENGATLAQLMAIFGWATAEQAMHYVDQANQPKVAGGAMHLIVANG
jgi:integrase